jgi:hypothetical protein
VNRYQFELKVRDPDDVLHVQKHNVSAGTELEARRKALQTAWNNGYTVVTIACKGVRQI